MCTKVIFMLAITPLAFLSGVEIESLTVKDGKEKQPNFYENATYISGIVTPGNEQLLSSQKDQTVMSVLDPSLWIIWSVGVFAVAARGYFLIPSATSTPYVKITPKSVPVVVAIVCVWVLFVYFGTRYAAYSTIAIFTIFTTRGSFVCMESIFTQLFPHMAEYSIPHQLAKSKLRISSLLILSISVCLSTAWVVLRNECRIWILQAILSVCLCLTVVRVTLVASLKMGSMFFMVLMIYDVLMAVITTGASVKRIAIAATAQEISGENIPLFIKIPNLVHGSFTFCGRFYRLLGIGDVLLPGFFVSFCRNFDVFTTSKSSIYFVTSCIGYGFGLLMVFLAAELMSLAQPALLYLCPSTLLGVVCVGLYRGEFGKLWEGIPTETADDTREEEHEILPIKW